jgi:hypothetical protein
MTAANAILGQLNTLLVKDLRFRLIFFHTRLLARIALHGRVSAATFRGRCRPPRKQGRPAGGGAFLEVANGSLGDTAHCVEA